ncbi:MAG: tetratricopeptide repeat protein [Rhodospirillaceae bacterium]|nr:tetratricopeptide repeat protein [Rhodospirillaceae bacterium]
MATAREDTGSMTPEQALGRLAQAIDAGDYPSSRAIAMALLAAGGTDLELLPRLARLARSAGEEAMILLFGRLPVLIRPDIAAAMMILSRLIRNLDRQTAARLAEHAGIASPHLSEAHVEAGALYTSLNEPALAEAAYLRLAGRLPEDAAAWLNAGILGAQRGAEESFGHFGRALILAPDFADAWYALANAERRDLNHERAADCFRRALAVRPDFSRASLNLGNALRRAELAVPTDHLFQRALIGEPGTASALINLGHAALAKREGGAALSLFERAVWASPNDPRANLALTLMQLRLGDFATGWPRYDWVRRGDLPKIRRSIDLPHWPFEEAEPSGLLVWNDQIGIGEEIMFANVLWDVAPRFERMAFACSAKLVDLMARSFPGIDCVANEDGEPHPDLGDRPAQAPLSQILMMARADFADFPDHMGYLKADTDRVEAMRLAYRDGQDLPLVGITWSSPYGFSGEEKSMPIDLWGPVLSDLPARFVSIQYGEVTEDVNEARERFGIDILVDAELDVFEDVDGHAAQISAMDHVIAISNMAAPLAGALGKPVDMVLPVEIAVFWRWFHEREDSPWFPSMRIHRRAVDESRGELMQRVADCAARRLALLD